MIGEVGGPPGGFDDRFEIAQLLVFGQVAVVAQEVAGPGDDGHQIVEIMGDAAGQLAQRLQLLRLQQRFAGRLQLVLGKLLVGDVAGDLGEADQFAVVPPDRVDDGVDPEPRAILAQPPALGLEPPVAGGGAERASRKVCLDILRGEETRLLLPDDFLGAITLEPLGAGVPGRDHSLGIEQVNGIVGDRADQEPDTLLVGQVQQIGQ